MIRCGLSGRVKKWNVGFSVLDFVACELEMLSVSSPVKFFRIGVDFLGPLLLAVVEICSDFKPSTNVEPSLLKLFRNFWLYVALFGLAFPIQKSQIPTKTILSMLNSVGGMSTNALQAVGGPYMWNFLWSSGVLRISHGTPTSFASSVKWHEDELELNALHNPGSRRGSENEKVVVNQRAALSATLGWRVEVSAMSTISGVKATYVLAVAFLEIIRFSSNGGILSGALVEEVMPLLGISVVSTNVQYTFCGVAIGARWQAMVAYMSLGCYFVDGILMG